MKNKFIAFLKNEAVLIISFFLALISVLAFRPSCKEVFSFIDLRVLTILFSLMLVIQAFKSTGLLDWSSYKILLTCSTVRKFYFMMIFFVFISSMFLTNDVTLLTFVPLTLMICIKANISSLKIIILETLAANLGSCFTPMGNPQNLYLYSFYKIAPVEFFLCTLKLAFPSIVLLIIFTLLLTRKNPNEQLSVLSYRQRPIVNLNFKFFLYVLNFILAILCVFHLVDYKILLAVTVLVILICNFTLFKFADYSLLFTFVFLFIFTGTLSSVEKFASFLQKLLSSPFKTYSISVLVSQFISNVPCALLLSRFTEYAEPLLLGVNVGGLGTVIASMASLISFKLYNASENKMEGESFIKTFSIYNVLFLIVLFGIVWVLFLIQS